MNRYNAIVIDDEFHIREAMKVHLESNCPEIKYCGMANSAASGRKLLEENDVDIIFLDISMPSEDGFTFLKSIDASEYAVIFVTAYQEYALKALKANAVDYLLKPINATELKEAVTKAIQYLQLRRNKPEAMDTYLDSIANLHQQVDVEGSLVEKITIPEPFGFRLVQLEDVIYFEADGNYTLLHLNTKEKLTATRTLGDFDKILEGTRFFRIHKSYLINLNYLKGFSNYQGTFAEMQNGAKLHISRRKIIDFKNVVSNFAKIIT
ncbi:MAG TPA: DNA-binding response regulator [Saprospirales bacterium]|nr:DNA-binding response regulator [Saprospirales bacterium]